jgi:hypothetical protein
MEWSISGRENWEEKQSKLFFGCPMRKDNK